MGAGAGVAPSPANPSQVYDVVEIFAGKARLSRCLLACGYRVASLDISYWKDWASERQKAGKRVSKNNPLDLTTDAGFARLADLSDFKIPFCSGCGLHCFQS